MKVVKEDIGRACRVKFDDVGEVNGILLEILDVVISVRKRSRLIRVFFPYDRSLEVVERCQILRLGRKVVPKF